MSDLARGSGTRREGELQRERLQRLGAVAVALLALLAARLWYLQIMRGAHYAGLADRNRIRVVPITAPRGLIVDRNGETMVRNRLSFTVSVMPDAFTGDRLPLAGRLASILGVSEEEIQKAWRESGRRYAFEPVRLVRDVTPEQLIAIEEHRLELPGVLVEEEPVRDYPNAETAAHLLGELAPITLQELRQLGDAGYRATDLIGRSGLERQYERVLRGVDGARRVEVDALGRPRRLLEEVAAQNGNDLHLTVDLALQRDVEQALREGVEKAEEARPRFLNGERTRPIGSGAAIVIDPDTGAILAMASFPAYNPQALLPWSPTRREYYQSLVEHPFQPFLNRATQGEYPPGSIFKVVTAVAALEEGLYQPGEMFLADGYGPYNKKDWMMTAARPLPPPGLIDILGGFEWSSNDFFWMLGARLGIDTLADWSRRFGLGSPVRIDLPGARPGLVPDREYKRRHFRNSPEAERIWYPSETLDVAIGQGFLTTTPIQMARIYMAVANGGTMYRLHLLDSVTAPDGRVLQKVVPEVEDLLPVRPETWELVREGLRRVVSGPHGTARGAFSGFPVPVAGKTGTAQVSAGAEPHAWFVGMAPADDPAVVVLTMIENGGSGAGVAAPVARRILEAYFGRYPDRAGAPPVRSVAAAHETAGRGDKAAAGERSAPKNKVSSKP